VDFSYTKACSSRQPWRDSGHPGWQAFGLFMLRDVQVVEDPTFYTSILAMVGQLCAALVAIPSGRLSDRLGRKPLVYAACVLMALVYFGFAMSPPLEVVLLLGVGFGIGNGV